MDAPKHPPQPDFLFVETPEDLQRTAEALSGARVIAVDTEADSMHSFFEKVCLVQLAVDGGAAFIIDPLALDDLAPLEAPFAGTDAVKVFHGADFDVSSLRRDYQFEFREIFDTMIASVLLGDEKLSLRDLVLRFFDVSLEKAYTRCDWGRRPLAPDQLAYCFHDVAFLVELMEIQSERLAEADLVEEARIEFDRLALREAVRREFSPHGWAKIKGSRDLGSVGQSVLAELFRVRDEHGRRLDRPVFKVIGNDTLLRIARARPQSPQALRAMKGVSGYAGNRMSRDILGAVRKGEKRGSAPPVPRTRGDESKRMDMSAQKRLGRLRDWRNEAAAKNRMTTMAVLPNYAMFEVARVWPRSFDDLGDIPGVGTKRADRWGESILRLLS